MNCKLVLDEKNYCIGFSQTFINDNFDLNPEIVDLSRLNCYRLINDELILDEEKLKEFESRKEKAKIQIEIDKLKTELSATDYQAIKYAEGWFTEEEYAPIKTMRENLREQIRVLESEIINGEL